MRIVRHRYRWEFIQAIKNRADVQLFHVSEENRDRLPASLIELILRG